MNSYSELDQCIVFNHVNVGRRCRIRRAIIDRHVSLPEGTVIGYDSKPTAPVTPSPNTA